MVSLISDVIGKEPLRPHMSRSLGTITIWKRESEGFMSRNSKHRTTALIFIGLLLLSACGSSEQKQGGETYSPSSPSGTTDSPSAFSFSFDPDNVNLGSVARYSNTSSQTVTLKNTGIQKMTCYAPYSYGPNSRDFTIVEDNCVDRPVIAGQQCTYRIRSAS